MNVDRISPGQLRVLAGVLDLRRQGRPITYRSLARHLGQVYGGWLPVCVRDLRAAGLLHPPEGSGSASCISPAVRFVAEDRL